MRIPFGGFLKRQGPNGLVDWKTWGNITHDQKRQKILSYILAISCSGVGMDQRRDSEKSTGESWV